MTYNVSSGTLNPTCLHSEIHTKFVFVLTYTALSVGRKTPKIVSSPWDFVTPPQED